MLSNNFKGDDILSDAFVEKLIRASEGTPKPLESKKEAKPLSQRVSNLNELPEGFKLVEGGVFAKDAGHHLWSIEKDGSDFLLTRSAEEEETEDTRTTHHHVLTEEEVRATGRELMSWKIDKTSPLWVVVKPEAQAVLEDVVFETTLSGLRNQFKGGLEPTDIIMVTDNKEEAIELAHEMLNIRESSPKEAKQGATEKKKKPKLSKIEKQILQYCNKARTSSEVIQLYPARGHNILAIMEGLKIKGCLMGVTNKYKTHADYLDFDAVMTMTASKKEAELSDEISFSPESLSIWDYASIGDNVEVWDTISGDTLATGNIVDKNELDGVTHISLDDGGEYNSAEHAIDIVEEHVAYLKTNKGLGGHYAVFAHDMKIAMRNLQAGAYNEVEIPVGKYKVLAHGGNGLVLIAFDEKDRFLITKEAFMNQTRINRKKVEIMAMLINISRIQP